MEFEVCIDSIEGAIAASKYNAKRVELCAALSEGGLTPSLGMIEACVKNSKSEVYVMIRSSAGGFDYSEEELELMERDIRAAASVGAHGVVFGVLNGLNEVDVKKNTFLIETAMELGLGTTFHRAIDLCVDPIEALEHIINLGFDRILTSGSKRTALEGIEIIEELVKVADGRIEIMAGSGIYQKNAELFMNFGLNALHFTAKKTVIEGLKLDMGPKYVVDEEKIEGVVNSK